MKLGNDLLLPNIGVVGMHLGAKMRRRRRGERRPKWWRGKPKKKQTDAILHARYSN